MDDSDQDFVDLCSKLLKRVRRKAGDTGVQRKADPKPSTQKCGGDSSKRRNKKDKVSKDVDATRSVSASPGGAAGRRGGRSDRESDPEHPPLVNGSGAHDSGDHVVDAAAVLDVNGDAKRDLRAKDKVLLRMQQFKRVSPQKLIYNEKNHPKRTEKDECLPPRPQGRDSPEPSTSGFHHAEPQDGDEALALRLQRELDKEAAVGRAIDLVDGGLFFCQLCHRSLSHMTPEGRTQHLNRCLDETESHAPPPPPPTPGVPDCPICGKRFKSLKSRSVHLKRCSSDLGVSPANLLQAVHRQTAESDSAALQPVQTGGSKRKGVSNPSLPLRKKPRKKAPRPDEDTMVALALSSSMLEQERERQRVAALERELHGEAPLPTGRPGTGKSRGKRRKGGGPRPLPLLLVQDMETALKRLQERVASLLIHARAPSPPTPTRCPSSLPARSGAAPLWQKTALREGGPGCPSEFYTPELSEFIVPSEPTRTDPVSATEDKPDTSTHPAVGEGTPCSVAKRSILASASPAPPPTPGTGQLPVGSQTLNDLIDLADEGLTLTQWSYGTSGPSKDMNLSGFIPEGPELQAELCLSGSLPDPAALSPARRSSQPRAETQAGAHTSVFLSRLVSDLSSLVNNPQLSDVQLQVDSGEVFFTHSFMLYARCPLLVQMIHDSGFGVQEEGMPAAQRVLLGEVPGPAVQSLLQYLYTAHCLVTPSLQPHLLELASRFDLAELQQLCQTEIQGEWESWEDCPAQEQQSGAEEAQKDQTFLELLRSMWNEEDDDDDDDDGRGRVGAGDGEMGLGDGGAGGAEDMALGDGEIREERVNEEEMEEIYEFAATQRKRGEEEDSLEEEEEEGEEGDLDMEVEEEQQVSKPNATEPKCVSTGSEENDPHLRSGHDADAGLDRSYSRLFSDSWGVYEEDPSSPPSSSSRSAKTKASRSQRCGSPLKLSSRRDAGERPSDGRCLQSSVSEIIDLSISPPPSVSNLPVPGSSPGAASDQVDGGHEGTQKDHACVGPKDLSKEQVFCREERLSPKRESQGPRSICASLSPESSKQPELIVLSDSSEEVEPEPANQNLRNYTRIRTPPNPEPNDPSLETGGSECGACAPVPAQSTNPMDCSAEVSWLIPSTPVQSRRSANTSTSSTQTHSSMCRMQLFPKAASSSSSSSSELKVRPRTSSNSCRVSTLITQDGQTAPPQHVPAKETPLHGHTRPWSSTPLHTDVPAPSAASPILRNPERECLRLRGRGLSESPDERGLEALRLSPSDPSPHGGSPGLHSGSAGSDCRKSPGGEPAERGVERSEEGEGAVGEKGTGTEGGPEEATASSVKKEIEEAEISVSSFCQSFTETDEPPMAFNDSWGLDAADGEASRRVRFSLRLEDSGGGASAPEEMTSSPTFSPSAATRVVRPFKTRVHDGFTPSPPPSQMRATGPKAHARVCLSLSPSPPEPTPPARHSTPEVSARLLDPKNWDDWEEDAIPLSQRVRERQSQKVPKFKTPVSSRSKERCALVPITPMPSYSVMDTPELKNKLNRFGVRPLPKRQMILKLKEIHHYTHQLSSSESEDEAPALGRMAQVDPLPTSSRPVSCAHAVEFKQPRIPSTPSPVKGNEEDAEPLSASQGSNTSSAAASEESERSNPELCISSDGGSDSDGGVTASQAVSRHEERLQAVRSFILADPELYGRVLRYQPLVLSQLQARLKAAGIRLGVAKLLDYLDSQCITFTTAKPSGSANPRRRGKGAKAPGRGGGVRGRRRGGATSKD